MNDQPVDASGAVADAVLLGLARQAVQAILISIDVALSVFSAQLRTMKIDDDLRMVAKLLRRVMSQ